MNIQLQGKTAVVTGSTAGIGYAIAKGLGAAGAWVIVNGRTEERVAQALQHLKDELPQGKFKGVAADLGAKEGVSQFIQQVPQADILVNNLGIFEPKRFFEIPDEDWERFSRSMF